MLRSRVGVSSLRSSVSISVVLHAFVLAVFAALLRREIPRVGRETLWVEIEPPISEPRARDRSLKERRQIVQTAQGELVERAKDDALLGERNQRVERETVSRERTTLVGREARPASTRAQGPQQKLKDLSKLGMAILPPMATRQPQDQPRWSTQSGAPQDWVRGVSESDRTALHTKEYVFYGYFQRIRERLDRAWFPILRARLLVMFRNGRQLASDRDHTTQVTVILNGRGEVVRIRMTEESGVRELDEAAVKAFNQAGPFPNPPKGIVDSNGEIQIPWEFVLKS